jgi:TPR repeat protein
MYLVGEAVKQDYERAAELYHQSALQGHIGAFGNLGRCYAKGWGVPQNDEEAYYWLYLAIEEGYTEPIALKDEVADKLSGKQRKAIEKKAEEWLKSLQ